MSDAQKQSSPVLRLRLKHAPWRLTTWLQPHEYLIASDDPEIAWIINTMREQLAETGYWDTYGGYRNQYLEIGGFRYWLLGDCLNRERLPISKAWPGSNPE